MKYSKKKHQQYLTMLDRVGASWQNAMGGRIAYRNSAGWRLLTQLWRDEKIKMSDAYRYLSDQMSPNTQRRFVLNAIRDGLIDCDDDALVQKERGSFYPAQSDKSKTDHGRRGFNSPLIWLSEATRQDIDSFFDSAIEEVIRTAETVQAD